jgi:hypothetical protein
LRGLSWNWWSSCLCLLRNWEIQVCTYHAWPPWLYLSMQEEYTCGQMTQKQHVSRATNISYLPCLCPIGSVEIHCFIPKSCSATCMSHVPLHGWPMLCSAIP